MISNALVVQTLATFVKIAILAGMAFNVAPIMTWVERRQMAYTQRRLGPNRVGIFGFRVMGLIQPLADTLKLLFKEDFFPTNVNRLFYFLAPVIVSTTAMMALMAIPFGSSVTLFGETIDLRVVNLNVGFLYLFAMSGLGVYGVALAGWASNNKYALLGGLRSSAQMISYELAMGLSFVPPILIYGTLDLQEIIHAQAVGLWGFIYAPVSCLIFTITMFAETNRLPFDLAEGESELVAGFLVEYGGMRWSQFFLGEYTMMFVLALLNVCLYFGGYELPFLPSARLNELLQTFIIPEIAQWVVVLLNLAVLVAKVALFMILFAQVRFTLPRFRYDQLMRIGWYALIPLALLNIVVTALVAGIVHF
jgi:NADH-quinone oxidoreductase subunit H